MQITELQAELARRLAEHTGQSGDLTYIASQTGISLAQLSRIRKGTAPLPLTRVDAVAAALGLKVDIQISVRTGE